MFDKHITQTYNSVKLGHTAQYKHRLGPYPESCKNLQMELALDPQPSPLLQIGQPYPWVTYLHTTDQF